MRTQIVAAILQQRGVLGKGNRVSPHFTAMRGAMIGLVRLQAPREVWPGFTRFSTLPPYVVGSFSGFAVLCRTPNEVADTLGWYQDLLQQRADVPLGLVAEPGHSAVALAAFPHPLAFFTDPRELVAGTLPVQDWNCLAEATIEGKLMDEVVSEYGPLEPEQESLLATLIHCGANGRSLNRAASDLAITPATIQRRVAPLPVTAGVLLRRVRHRAFEVRVDLGVDRTTALIAGGWFSHEDRRKSKQRLRQALKRVRP